MQLLERLLVAAETGGREGNVIEILVQLALAAEAEGNGARATELLRRALVLGEAEGHVRVFLDVGPTLTPCSTGSAGLARRPARPRGVVAGWRGATAR